VLIVILEGLQHLFQFQHNWIIFRSTCENLKHEKYLWLAKAGPYVQVGNPDAILSERIGKLILQEHAKWIVGQERTVQIKNFNIFACLRRAKGGTAPKIKPAKIILPHQSKAWCRTPLRSAF